MPATPVPTAQRAFLRSLALPIFLFCALGSAAWAGDHPLADSPLLIERLEARWQQMPREDRAELEAFTGTLRAAERVFDQLGFGPDERARLDALREQTRRALAPDLALPPVKAPVEVGLGQSTALQGADDCTQAPLVPLGSYLGTTEGSTRDSVAFCAPLGAAGDVWYRVRVGAGESLFASTAGSGFDTVLSIHEVCPQEFFAGNFELACDDDGGPGQTSAVSWGPAFAETQVLVRVSGALVDSGPYQLLLGTGGRIEGRVLDDFGQPLGDVPVQLQSDQTLGDETAFTGADGRFAFGDLTAGSYRLAVPRTGAFRGELFDDLPCLASDVCLFESADPIAVALGETVELGEIRLTRGAAVEGRVSDRRTGQPVSDALVEVRNVESLAASSSTVGGDGTFRIEGLPAGESRVTAKSFGDYQDQAWDGVECPFDCGSGDGDPLSLVLGETVTGIDFMLSALGRIEGQVRSQAGAPLAVQSVGLFDQQALPLQTVFTDPDGRYSFGGVPPGSYFAVAAAEPLGPWVPELYRELDCIESPSGDCAFDLATPIDVVLDGVTAGVDFTLSAGGSLAGTVTDGVDGEPQAGVLISAVPEDGFFVKQSSTGPDGSYRLTGLPGGDYRVVAEPPGEDLVGLVYPDLPCSGGCSIEQGTPVRVVFEQELSPIDFHLPRTGVIRGRLTAADTGEPLGGLSVLASGADFAFTTSNPDGRYQLSGLDPGDYRVDVAAVPEGFLFAFRDVVLGPGETVDGIDFELVQGGRISGRVENAFGLDRNAHIEVRDADLRLVATAFAQGDYEVRSLPTGTYFVQAFPQDLVPQLWPGVNCPSGVASDCPGAQEVAVTVGQTVTGIDFVPDAFAEILGVAESAVTGFGVGGSVEMYDADGALVGTSSAVFNGIFGFSRVEPGTYYFIARPSRGPYGYMDQVYGGASCIGVTCDPLSGTPVTVGYNASGGAFFQLERGGSLSGRLTDAGGGLLAGAFFALDLFDGSGELLRSADVDSGRWFFGALPPGDYRLLARDLTAGDYFDRVWPDVDCAGAACSPSAGEAVAVNLGQDVGGLDFAVESVEPISGRAVAEQTGLPAVGATVQRWSPGGVLVEQTRTGSDGGFSFVFREDSYLSISSSLLQDEVWPDVPCPNGDCRAVLQQGELVSPRPGQATDGFDFSLDFGLECGSATELCTLENRFRTEVRWMTDSAQGSGGPVPLTNESGYFWFFDPANVEVVVKTLDACDGFGHYWVFLAGLTNVDVQVTVTDTFTGAVRTYRHRPDDLFVPIYDTTAFATCGAADTGFGGFTPVPAPERAAPAPDFGRAPAKSCQPDDRTACLNDGRFRVEGRFRAPGLESNRVAPDRVAPDRAWVVPLSSDTAYFWFFSPDNVEVVLKVLDACDGWDRFWVFAAGLTNVEVELTVTDTETGAVWTYDNRQGQNFQPVADTSSLLCP